MKCDRCPGGELEKRACKPLQCQCYGVPYARAHKVVRAEFLKAHGHPPEPEPEPVEVPPVKLLAFDEVAPVVQALVDALDAMQPLNLTQWHARFNAIAAGRTLLSTYSLVKENVS